MSRLADVLLLGFLTLLCSLPIVTIGASLSALYYVLLRIARGTEEGIIRDYFKGFRQNFLKGTALWFIMAIIIAVFYADFVLLSSIAINYGDLVKILLAVLGAFLLMVGSYVFPMQAQFENSIFGTLKKSFLICVMNLPKSFILLLILLCPILILLFFPETIYFLPFVCIAVIPYLQTEILVRVFERYMPKEDTEDGDDS
jgi:uncharacterized membrane protein YesL